MSLLILVWYTYFLLAFEGEICDFPIKIKAMLDIPISLNLSHPNVIVIHWMVDWWLSNFTNY